MKSKKIPDSSLQLIRDLTAPGLILALLVSTAARAETIAGIDFDDDAFVDSVISSFGSYGPTVWFTSSVGASDSAAVIGTNIDTFAHSLSSGAYLEIGFRDNAVVNGPGPDLGIFELGGVLEPQFFTLTVADMLASNNIIQVNTSFTGFTNNLGLNINYGTLDLSDLGLAPGATVKSLVLTSVCDAATSATTGGACTTGDRAMAAPAVIGALNSVYSGLDSLQKYDNFNSKKVNGCKGCLDTELWRVLERGNYNTEVEVEVKSKRARLYHRSWGRSDSDTGSEQGRARLNFRNSANFSGACFTPRVKKYELSACESNASDSAVRIRYLGNFYDTDNADAGEEDGVVYAGITMRRGSWTNKKKGVFEVDGFVYECAGTDCAGDAWSTYDDVNDPDLFFGFTRADKNKKEFCAGYDRDNHEFVISYGNDVRIVNGPDHGLPAFGDDVATNWTWHALETRIDVPSCTAGKLYGSIDADVDNVKIREFQ